LITFTIQNAYFSKNIKNNFIQMNKNELFFKNTSQSIFNDISNLNKQIVTASIADEVTKEVLEDIQDYNDDITDNLSILLKSAQENNKPKMVKLLKTIQMRYKTFYTMAYGLPEEFKSNFDDGIDAIIGLDAISSKMFDEIDILIINADKNFNTRVMNINSFINDTSHIYHIYHIYHTFYTIFNTFDKIYFVIFEAIKTRYC